MVELKIYHLDKDPTPGKPYQPITAATVVINRSAKISRVNADSLQRNLELAEKEPEPTVSEG